ncbi:MAG: HAD family hydrolase [Firmicutes bacterium]|nr:HAD family hydrolase [Bacillota bacterium]
MRTTFLFDLDGTLLPLDQDSFVREYFKLLVPELIQFLPADRVVETVMESTRFMIADSSAARTNRQAFMEDFCKKVPGDPDELTELFDSFYRGKFSQLATLVSPADEIGRTVQTLKTKGYELVCATNPIFPLSAIETRLGWIGLDPSDFLLITSYEDMHFCKPDLNYYRETLQRIDRRPDECIMVGNDVEEDIVACRLGIETFLVTPYAIDRGSGLVPDHRGTYADLLRFVEALPEVGGRSARTRVG